MICRSVAPYLLAPLFVVSLILKPVEGGRHRRPGLSRSPFPPCEGCVNPCEQGVFLPDECSYKRMSSAEYNAQCTCCENESACEVFDPSVCSMDGFFSALANGDSIDEAKVNIDTACLDEDQCISPDTSGAYVSCQSVFENYPNGSYEAFVEPELVIDCTSLDLSCRVPVSTASAPTAPKSGGSGGDPHIKSWSGQWYDFHASCDLVLLSSPSVPEGLDIHIRTAGRYTYSYISSAAIKIGYDIFQVDSWGGYSLNSVSGATLPAVLGTTGFVVDHVQVDEKKHVFNIFQEEEGGARIIVNVFKDLVSVDIVPGIDEVFFEDSVGLMGSFGNGTLLGRDATTVLSEDLDKLGQDWQVQPEKEGMLFVAPAFPQYPEACVFPDLAKQADRRRRLGATVAQTAAEQACSHWDTDEERKKLCVFDVMATGDLEVAQAGAF